MFEAGARVSQINSETCVKLAVVGSLFVGL